MEQKTKRKNKQKDILNLGKLEGIGEILNQVNEYGLMSMLKGIKNWIKYLKHINYKINIDKVKILVDCKVFLWQNVLSQKLNRKHYYIKIKNNNKGDFYNGIYKNKQTNGS